MIRRTPLPPGTTPLARGGPLLRHTQIRRATQAGKSAARRSGATGRRESFPPAVAALIDARDPWCIHCGSPYDLDRHHRRIKGMGGDKRDHTDCACDGVRICRTCHQWAHSGDGQREAEAEGLIIPRSTTEPYRVSVLVHTSEDGGGMRKWPLCDGTYADEEPEVKAA